MVVLPEVQRLAEDCLVTTVDGRIRNEDCLAAGEAGQFIATLGIGLCAAHLLEPWRPPLLLPLPERHRCPSDRLAAATLDHIAGVPGLWLRMIGGGDHRQPTDPDKRGRNDVVAVPEILSVTGQQPVSPCFKLGSIKGVSNRQVLAGLSKVIRCWQVGCKRFDSWQGENCLAVLDIEPRPGGLACGETFLPVRLRQPQVHPSEIAIADRDGRPGSSPGSLSGKGKFLGLNPGHQIAALFGPNAVRMRGDGGQRNRPCICRVFLSQTRSQVKPGQRRQVMVTSLLNEQPQSCLQCLLRFGVGIGHGGATCPEQPVEVRGEEGRTVLVGSMEVEQFLIEPDDSQQR